MTDIARRDQVIAALNKENAALKEQIKSPLELLAQFIDGKDEEIAALKATLAGNVSASAIAHSHVGVSTSVETEEDDASSSDDSSSDDSCYEDDGDENKDPAHVEGKVFRPVLKSCLKNGTNKTAVIRAE